MNVFATGTFFHWGGHLSSPTFLINFSAPHLGPQMEWISSTLSENNHTFLVWHEKPTFVASCGLMCPQNHTCVGRCGLVVASRACFPCKKSHPDPRTTRNFRHFSFFSADFTRRARQAQERLAPCLAAGLQPFWRFQRS